MHRVATRYAKSLIDQAQSLNQLEPMRQDVLTVIKTLKENRELTVMYKSPIINSGKKSIITQKVFEGNVSVLMNDFLQLLISKKREGLIDEICNAFIDQYNLIQGISRVFVTSALPMNEATRSSLLQQLEKETGRKVELHTNTDPAILGGLVIRYDDRLYDASIQSKLRKIKQELTQAF